LLSADAQRTRPAHAVVEQLERDGIADLEVVEVRALLKIRAMKEDREAISKTNLAVTLSHQQAADSPRRGSAAEIEWPRGIARQ
jgi:hypothetical protein